jgi:hypothetical protein
MKKNTLITACLSTLCSVLFFYSCDNPTSPVAAVKCELIADTIADKDLPLYLAQHINEPGINAVQVKAGELKQALANTPDDVLVYVSLLQSSPENDQVPTGGIDPNTLNMALVTSLPDGVFTVCNFQAGGGRCCPPPLKCSPGFVNRLVYLSNPEPIVQMP